MAVELKWRFARKSFLRHVDRLLVEFPPLEGTGKEIAAPCADRKVGRPHFQNIEDAVREKRAHPVGVPDKQTLFHPIRDLPKKREVYRCRVEPACRLRACLFFRRFPVHASPFLPPIWPRPKVIRNCLRGFRPPLNEKDFLGSNCVPRWAPWTVDQSHFGVQRINFGHLVI